MGNYFYYMRISTKEERGQQKYNRQEAAIKKYVEKNHIEYILGFQEDVSGKSFENRKEWNKLESYLHPGDTIIFKDISRFTREAKNGYDKYMQLMDSGVDLIFLDNPTVSTPYIKDLLRVADEQDLVAKTSMEGMIKLLLVIELDRVEKERLILIERTKAGIAASEKTQGRKKGTLDKFSPELKEDIQNYLSDRTVKQIDLMKKHQISRNTLKKYIGLVQAGSI